MIRWHYAVIQSVGVTFTEKELAAHGDAGWELVSVTTSHHLGGGQSGWLGMAERLFSTAYFKRAEVAQ